MWIASFAVQKLLSLIRSRLLISVFISFALGDRILEEHTEALTGFSHVYHSDGLNNTLLSQGDSSWNTVIMWAGCSFQGWGDGEEPLIAQVQLTSQPEVTSSL